MISGSMRSTGVSRPVPYSCGTQSGVRLALLDWFLVFNCFLPNAGLTYNQLNNNLVSQAATMSTHGLPNDVLSNLDPLALIIFIPICDFFVSLLRLLLFV